MRLFFVMLVALTTVSLWATNATVSVSSSAGGGGEVTQMVVRVTGYCNCGTCCSWRRSWFGLGRPVYSKGRLKGRPKKVGVTARGTIAKKGTIAADVDLLPFGTRLVVPGYGVGTVEDVGGTVVGNHIDIWFPTHAAARAWGSQILTIEVQRPKTEKTTCPVDLPPSF